MKKAILILALFPLLVHGQVKPKNVEFSITSQSGTDGVTLHLDSGGIFVPNGGKVMIRSDTVILSAAALNYITKPLRDQIAQQASELKMIIADWKRQRDQIQSTKKPLK